MSYYTNIQTVKAVPGTEVNIIDNSQIKSKTQTVINGPVFLCAAACDKGTEELTFYNDINTFRSAHLNNNIVNFEKYGLPLYAVDEIIESGSGVYFKRIVSEDAKLANLGVVAVVNKIEEQKVNSEGKPLYKDQEGLETTEATSTILNPNYIKLSVSGNVTGTTNSEVNSEITVTIQNDKFKDIQLSSADNINDWFSVKEKTILSELTFKVTEAPSGENNQFKFTVTGTPTQDIEKEVTLTIPAEKLESNKSKTVDINFSINASGGTVLRKSSKNSKYQRDVNTEDEFIQVDNTPIMITKAGIQFGVKYIENCKNILEVEHGFDTIYQGPEKIDFEAMELKASLSESLEDLPDAEISNSYEDPDFPDLIIDENSYVLPLFIITDKGRGVSNKRIRIVPDYATSKYRNFFRYKLEIIESGKILASHVFSFDPEYIENSTNRSIENQAKDSVHLDVKVLESYYDEFFKVIEEFSGIDRNTINKSISIVDGKDSSGKLIPEIKVSGVNLQHTFGIRLSGGNCGKFGNNNANVTQNEEYNQLLKDFYNGDLDDNVWNRDEIFFNLVIDANYPQEVKRAIEYLCSTREDVSCLLDMTTSISEFNDYIVEIERYNKHFTNNVYYQYGQIQNKFNKKKITTTLPMLIAKRLRSHFLSGRSKPMAGKSFGFSFPEFIANSLNHTPKQTPKVDEKSILVDKNINYGSILNGTFTLETNYTTQEEHTQLSYSSNVFAIQHLIQDLRKSAPEVRYKTFTDKDLQMQKDKYDSVCNRHLSNFNYCKFNYVANEEDELLKTFRGQIVVVCKDYTIKEVFDIFVVHQDDAENIFTIAQ